mmetsp:Transcript_8500/g.24115  ORF Transcript_8500/g.24115 Transcript_8500/m.24115 type:complete len:258 (+) Transcript_8500:8281-9054(+)
MLSSLRRLCTARSSSFSASSSPSRACRNAPSHSWIRVFMAWTNSAAVSARSSLLCSPYCDPPPGSGGASLPSSSCSSSCSWASSSSVQALSRSCCLSLRSLRACFSRRLPPGAVNFSAPSIWSASFCMRSSSCASYESRTELALWSVSASSSQVAVAASSSASYRASSCSRSASVAQTFRLPLYSLSRFRRSRSCLFSRSASFLSRKNFLDLESSRNLSMAAQRSSRLRSATSSSTCSLAALAWSSLSWMSWTDVSK